MDYLAKFWNALVKVRPEFGMMGLKDRKALRGTSIAGTARQSTASSPWRMPCSRPAAILTGGSLGGLKDTVVVNGKVVDYFGYENPIWQTIGALVTSKDSMGVDHLSLRMSFQTRSAMAKASRRSHLGV